MANEKPDNRLTKAKLLKKAKNSFKIACEAESEQRKREKEDLRFQVDQWTEAAKGERDGSKGIPPRPMLSISLLTQPLQLIQNQATSAHLGVEVHPVSEKAYKEIAEIKQGLYRRIERDSNADLARLWALDRAKQCGRGWYRVNTKWDEDGDNPFDQEIVIERILCQENVYMDPSAQKADFSDARWGMVVGWVPIDTFREEFPKAKVPATDEDFKAWETDDPEWVVEDGDEKAVLVAEYFYKAHDRVEVKIGPRQKRVMDRVSVKYCKVTGKEVIEEQDWAGKYIPLVPVIGRELQGFDGERRWEGIVRQARDGQRFFNFAASNAVEAMALEPKAPWVGAEGQFAGHEEEWDTANIRNWPKLEYKPTSHENNLNPPPQRAQVDSSRMVLAMQALGQAKEFVQSATAVYEPSLGEMPSRRESQSGRAILALQQQSDAGTSHFLQNLAKISMAYEARVILDLMPAIYDRPGRVTQILGAEDNPKTVMLGKPFVPGQDGRPQPAPPPVPGLAPPEGVKFHDLSKGKYAISVSVGKAFQTRLQEGQATIGAILERQPQLMPIVGDIFFKYQDTPGSTEIGKRLEKMREKQFPGLGDDEEEGMTLDQAQAQMQGMQQQMEQMGQQMQGMQQALETDKAKQEATIAKTQMETQSRESIAQLEAQTKLVIETMRQQAEQQAETMKQQFEALQASLDRRHEEESDELDVTGKLALEAMKPGPVVRGREE